MIALILAAGEAVRWQGGILKQLMPIGDMTVLARMMRQAEAWAEVMVVSHEPEIQAASGDRTFQPPNHQWLVETLLSTKCLWQQRTVILLGDVFYSDETIETIMSDERPVAIFGSYYELFALSFGLACSDRISQALTVALEDAHKGGLGKLWQFYRAYCGFPLNKAYFEDRWFVMVEDETDDIDTLEEYHAFCERTEMVAV